MIVRRRLELFRDEGWAPTLTLLINVMSWTKRTKMALASIVFRHRVLNRWAHKQLPRKRMAAGVLLYDEAGRLLVVKPYYRRDWLIPGGIVESNEAPWEGARRETMEEVGLDIRTLRLLVVDWRCSDDSYDDSLHFIFDGGVLSAGQQAAIRPDGVEIVEARFAGRDEAIKLVDPHLMARILPCWDDQPTRPLIMNSGEADKETL